MTPKRLGAFAKARRGFPLIEDRHPGVALTHEVVVHGIRLGLGLFGEKFVTLTHKVLRGFAKQQPANLNVLAEAGIGID
jgi:hypothetical protein